MGIFFDCAVRRFYKKQTSEDSDLLASEASDLPASEASDLPSSEASDLPASEASDLPASEASDLLAFEASDLQITTTPSSSTELHHDSTLKPANLLTGPQTFCKHHHCFLFFSKVIV
jgi:hypothetical protein